jgi:anti-sigma B factor antagonist
MLSLRIQRLGDATVFRCGNRITISDVDVLRIAALRQPGIRTLVLDLAEIIAVDAAGLGILVSLRAWAKESGVVLKLMNLTPRVQDLLELTNLKSAFQICSPREMLTLLCRAINDTQSTRFEAPIHDPDGVNEIMAETFFQPTKRPGCSTSYM